MEFDVIVIGGGSAGYAAADQAERDGARVAIIDPGPLGGLCILRGCMPTKTILRSSDIMSLMARAKEFGLSPVATKADLSAIIDRKNRLIGEFARYRVEQLKAPRFTLYEEKARFLGPHEIQAGSHRLSAPAFIIATGSVVTRFPIPGIDEAGYLTSDDVLELREQPQSLIVLGAGPVAVELAQFYQRLHTQVTLIQRSDHILSAGDADLAQPLQDRLREEGMQVFTGTRLNKVSHAGATKTVHFTHGGQEKTVSAEALLMALGRRPNIDGLDLTSAGVDTDGRVLTVDAAMRTSQPHIFAVGDVNGRHEIVHIAIQQGEVAGHNATHLSAEPKTMDDRLKTSVVFSDPQVASVGLSEKECRAQGVAYLAASYPFNDHGKSMTLGETHGHVKLLCRPDDGEIIGAHIVGPDAGELIHQLIAVMYYHGKVSDLLNMPHYHPTLSEIITYPAEELAEKVGIKSA